MSKVKTFQIQQKFASTKDLYEYLFKNVDFVGELIGIEVQKPMKAKPFCLVGREKITERNILFFASKSEFPESLGELIAMTSTFSIDVIVFFMPKFHELYLESLSWLQKICNDDTQFIVGEVTF